MITMLKLSDDALSHTYWRRGLEAFARRLATLLDNSTVSIPTSYPDQLKQCWHQHCIGPDALDRNQQLDPTIVVIELNGATVYLGTAAAPMYVAVMTYHGDLQLRSQANAMPADVIDYVIELIERLTTPDPEPQLVALVA